MNFAYTILYVENVAGTIDFYGRAFGLKKKMLHESGDFGVLDTGQTSLAFSSTKLMTDLGKSPGSPTPDAPTFEVAFTTSDVQTALDTALKAGAKLVQEPKKMPWGQTVAYVVDNNGFLVEICTPVDG